MLLGRVGGVDLIKGEWERTEGDVNFPNVIDANYR